MKLNIAVLAGDGIGPEIMKQGVAVMQAIAEKFNHEFTYNEAKLEDVLASAWKWQQKLRADGIM